MVSPKHSGRTPVARGSRLPVCPALFAWNIRFAFCKAWLEDIPVGLSSNNIPLICSPLRRLGLLILLRVYSESRFLFSDSINAVISIPRWMVSSYLNKSVGIIRKLTCWQSDLRKNLDALFNSFSISLDGVFLSDEQT